MNRPSPTSQPLSAALRVLSSGVKGGPGVADALGGGHPPIRSLYIHTPFCVHKCHYCDFYSFVDNRDQQGAFVDRLIEELEALAPHSGGLPLRTVFVGGGTPSLLRVELWEKLLGALERLFGVVRSAERPEEFEFTVECNPESATGELMRVLRGGGVNRISVGAQSFEARHLKTLERWHDPANVARAIEAGREAGIARQSVDLIYAIPGQTLAEWERDLARAASLGTTHVSCYNLTYEPNTPMTARMKRGEFVPVDEDLEAAMFERTRDVLGAAGLGRYEVSNYARPGDESRHNLAYWRQEQWLAAGPSASGHALAGPGFRAGSWRWKNVARLGDYLESKGTGGHSPAVDVEGPDPARLIRERLMMGLRLAEGIDGAELMADVRAIVPEREGALLRVMESLEREGLIERGGRARWAMTEKGMLVCDWAAGELMGAVSGDG